MQNGIKLLAATALVAAMTVAVGCGPEAKDKPEAKADPKADHGWWCDDHGVKESECSMCDAKVFKKLKPDEICPKHLDRAAAQCFICNPDLWPKSAAMYKAKFPGKEVPEPTKNMPEKK